MATQSPLSGGCLCGAIRYHISFPENAVYPPKPHTCQCTQCRKQSGALILHLITVPRSDVSWNGTKPSEYTSTPGVIRRFCNICGTSLSWQSEQYPNQIEMMTGTLDEAILMSERGKEVAKPEYQTWCCRFIGGVTDIINEGKKYEKGSDSKLIA